MKWINDHRPGYFGRQRDAKVFALDSTLGKGNWRLAWVAPESVELEALMAYRYAATPPAQLPYSRDPLSFEFAEACVIFYEESYFRHLESKPEELDFICSFAECIDNAPTNVKSGLDYTKQEAFSTHIQDIAVRNVLRRLGRKFEGPEGKLLIIRSADSEGFRFGPGNVPFFDSKLITQPSKCPKWAGVGSVEDFWQSNKWVQTLCT